MKSLFTSIPLQLALQCTETAILESTDPLPLPTEDIMDLLNLCLTSTQYKDKNYKQLHSTAMGTPVFAIVAEIIIQNIEESALSTCRQTIPLYLLYVDHTCTAVGHDEINAFYHHLNGQNTDAQFTGEGEENGKQPFLGYLESRDDNSLRTTVYRKLTFIERLHTCIQTYLNFMYRRWMIKAKRLWGRVFSYRVKLIRNLINSLRLLTTTKI